MIHRVLHTAFTLPLLLGTAPWCFCQPVEEQSVIARVSTQKRIAAARLTAGSVLEGELERPAFAGRQEVFPAGTRVRLVVSETSKQPGPSRGIARRMASLATGSPRPRPVYGIALDSALLILPDGRAIERRAEVLGILRHRRLSGSRREISAPPRTAEKSTILIRLGRDPGKVGAVAPSGREVPPAAGTEIPAGTRARVMLMRGLSASGSRLREPAEARLLEPLRVGDGIVIPAGSSFEGHVTTLQPPRRLFRPAKMRLNFDRLRMSEGPAVPISTVLTSADAQKGAGASMDSEGGISGGPATKKRLALDIAIAYGAGKLVDDLLEEGVKWGFGAAVSGTAATVARYVGIGTGLLFLAVQHGHDVTLPQYTELELTFTRPVIFGAATDQEW